MGYPNKTKAAILASLAAGGLAGYLFTALVIPKITIGTGGTTINKVVSATSTKDFAAIKAGYCTNTTMTVTGAALGDSVDLNIPANVMGISTSTDARTGISWYGSITAANVATLVACNSSSTASSANPPSGVFRVTAIHF